MMRSADTKRWDRLILVGFMGAGKSTVGALLASRLKIPFVDSDTAIEKQTENTIARLFEERGEAEFRSLEEQTVAGLLSRKRVVIALGGGALESPVTRRLLSESANTCVIHLEASLTTMLERCRKSAPVRPLLQDQASLMQRHAHRLEHYRAATITVLTDQLTPGAVVERLLKSLFVESPPERASLLQERSAQELKATEAAGQ